MASLFDRPGGYNYGAILPFRSRVGMDPDQLSTDYMRGDIEPAVPQLFVDMAESGLRLGERLFGKRPLDPGQTFVDTLEFGALASPLARMPAGAFGANAVRRAARELPMDEAARMARARKMGFDIQDAYHGTSSNIRAFSPDEVGSNFGFDDVGHFFTNDPSDRLGGASDYARGAYRRPDGAVVAWQDPETGPNVIPAFLRMKKPYTLEKYAEDIEVPIDDLMRYGDDIQDPIAIFDENRDEIMRLAREGGYDGLKFEYTHSDGYRDAMYAVFDPKNIRSRFAKFDPDQSESADLLASRMTLFPGAPTLFPGEVVDGEEYY